MTVVAIHSFSDRRVTKMKTQVLRGIIGRRMRLRTLEVKSVILLCVVALMANCDSTDPRVTENEEPHYQLYVGNWAGNQVHVVDVDSLAVLDTLAAFDSEIWNLAVTKSGSKLYVSTREGSRNRPGRVYAVDVSTSETDLVLGQVGDVFVTPQGTVLLIAREPHSEAGAIGIVDTVTSTVVFTDTLDITDKIHNEQSIVFERDRTVLYGINSDKRVFSYDYVSRQVLHVYESFGDPFHMILADDQRHLYVAGGPIVDLLTDTVVGTLSGNRLGHLAFSPDGDELYVTDPGAYMAFVPPPSGKVFVFDTQLRQYVEEIDVASFAESGTGGDRSDWIVVEPRTGSLYVSGWIAYLFRIDQSERQVTDFLRFDCCFTVPLAIGRQPDLEP